MRTLVTAFAIAGLLAACDDGNGKNDGLPPASSWQAPEPVGGALGGQNPHDGQNPHAGMAGMGNPHAGMAGMGGMGNPHAGVAGMGNPHAGMAVPPGFAPPDPDRPIDPNKVLKGQIVASKKTRGLIKAGDVLFLSARPIEPASGDIIGPPIAVDRIVVDKLPVSFELSGHSAMIDGTRFQGPVVIEARIDRDLEARTAEPGDVEGRLRAEIPAQDLRVVLDTVVE